MDQIISESPVMQKIFNDVKTLAKSTASVFISGESGTGKEVVAHAVHRESLRAQRPFIKVNCAAIPSSLLESEFFGHEKGSFTGAIQRRIGRFELADKGTLLLDEISEIPLELQPKLLRAVQEMEFERVGGAQPIHVDVRLISTSNRSMKETVEKKLFREDLYYRLNVVPVHLPPLRDRREDIVPLAEYFMARICIENGKPMKTLTDEAKHKLLAYRWPGNIRELANAMERVVIMNETAAIGAESIQLEEDTVALGTTLKEMEKKWILDALAKQQNNRTHAARVLGISVRTLRNKLKEYQSN
jgi:two-component system, NtrC family, response regulator AtoC